MLNPNPDAVRAFLETSKGYMMDTATAAVVDGKMEPMSAAPIAQQLVITGQALYNDFVGDTGEGVTKMNLIRSLIDKADCLQIAGACDKMVEIAKATDTANGVPEKVLKDGKEVVNRGPKTQSAMNCRTCIQQAFGALKFARSSLDVIGYKETTGYQDMRVLAKRALDTSGIKWTGVKLATPAERDQKAALKAAKAEMNALQEIQKANPFGTVIGESLQEWNARTFALAAEEMQEATDARLHDGTQKAFNHLIETLDENQLFNLTKMLIEHSPFSFDVVEEGEVVPA
jgi:hypothetical protein